MANALVQLIFEAVGIHPTAEAVRRLSEALNANTKALADEISSAAAATQATDALKQEQQRQADTAARTAQINAAVAAALDRVRGSTRSLADETPVLTRATESYAMANARVVGELEAARRSGLASEVAYVRQKQATADTAEVTRSFTERVRDLSASVNDRLLPSLDPAAKQIIALGAGMLTARLAYNALTGAIDQGSDLYYLSIRTGESIRDLVVAEQAFRNTGNGANYLGTAINLLDRALSPVAGNARMNERLFRQLGVSIDELRAQDFAARLQILSDAFARLPNQAERATIAMRLFGEEQGGRMLQLLGDPTAMAVAEQQAGRYGDRMALNAQRMANFKTEVNGATLELRELSTAAAVQLLPVLEGVNRLLGSIGGAGLGTAFGAAGPTAVGGLAAMWGIDKLDLMLLNAADNFRGRLAGSLAGAASQVTGALATYLPVGLAAAVASQVILGVLQAYQDSRLQDLRNFQRDVMGEVNPYRSRAAQVDSPEAAAANLLAAQIRLTELAAERAELQAREDEIRLNAMSGDTGALADMRRLDVLNEAVPKLALDIVNHYSNAEAVAKDIADTQLAALRRSIAPLVSTLPDLQQRNQNLQTKTGDPVQELERLMARRAELESKMASIPGGLDDTEKEAYRLDLENKILEIKKEEQTLQQKIDADNKRELQEQLRREVFALQTQAAQAEAAGNDELANQLKEQAKVKQAIGTLDGVDKQLVQDRLDAEKKIWEIQESQRKAREQTNAERVALQDQLAGLRENIASLEADYTRTSTEKWSERRDTILKELAALQRARDADRAAAEQARAAGQADAAAIFDRSAASNNRSLSGAQLELARLGPDPQSWSEQWRAVITDFRSQWEFSAQSVTTSLQGIANNGLNSITQNLAHAIVVTGDFNAAFAAIGRTILTELVSALIQMGIRYVATKLLMSAADKAAMAASVATSLPMALTMSQIWATPATLSTIATAGGTAFAAPTEIAIAALTTRGLALAEEGGFFPGNPKEARGIFHGDEFIFSAPAVRNIGADNLARIHSEARSGSALPASFTSGGGAGGGSGDSARNIHIYMDKAAYFNAIKEDVGGVAVEVFEKLARS